MVETVGNGDIFHDVCLVQHVRTSRGNIDIDKIWGFDRGSRAICHLVKEFSDISSRKVQSAALVDERNLCLGCAGRDIRGDTRLIVVLRNDLDGLNAIKMNISLSEVIKQNPIILT